MARQAIPANVRREVLIEAGFRCAVPTCRGILALDLHHIEEVQDGGPNETWNLLALCLTCHALYTRGEIPREAIQAWKAMLVSLSQALDKESISNLLFLAEPTNQELRMSGDGVLKFTPLISAGLAQFRLVVANGPLYLYRVDLTPKGEALVDAWRSGNRARLAAALEGRG